MIRTARFFRPTRLARTAVGLALSLLAVTGLSACSSSQVGAAAVVDGKSISTDLVQRETRAYLKVVPGTDGAMAQRQILQRMILSKVIARAAEDVGVSARPGAVARERDTLLKTVGGRTGLVKALAAQATPTVLSPTYINQWFTDRALYGKITTKLAGAGDPSSAEAASAASQALAKASRKIAIRISPRYGRWSPQKGVVALLSGGLSKSAEQIAASS